MPTPQRLPQVNGDDGVWGDIIRQYLMKEHYNDDTDNADNGGHQKITIRGGTAAAGTAPITLTSGTLMSTPETGAVEFNGDNLYFTQTSGTVRKKIALYDDASGATGDIYYRNNTGYFTRLEIGNSGEFLTVSSGVPVWGVATIPNTSTITVKDANFTIQDDADTTKQAKFELSSISTSATRTYTLPNASGTLALSSGILTPEAYGAVGNGSTDDTTAMNSWADAATQSGMTGALTPGKNYYITDEIILDNSGSKQWHIQGNGASITQGTNGKAIFAFTTEDQSQFSIENIFFDYTNQQNSGNSSTGAISADYTTANGYGIYNGEFRGLTFSGKCYRGIFLKETGGHTVTMWGNKFDQIRGEYGITGSLIRLRGLGNIGMPNNSFDHIYCNRHAVSATEPVLNLSLQRSLEIGSVEVNESDNGGTEVLIDYSDNVLIRSLRTERGTNSSGDALWKFIHSSVTVLAFDCQARPFASPGVLFEITSSSTVSIGSGIIDTFSPHAAPGSNLTVCSVWNDGSILKSLGAVIKPAAVVLYAGAAPLTDFTNSAVVIRDSNLTIQDNSDTTKQAKFELSSISASTTRTMTIPDANTTLVGTDTTQILTNKTIDLGNNTVTGVLAIDNGGTGANNAASALSSLGAVPTTRTINGFDLTTNRTLTQDDIGDGTTYKQYSQTEKTKLSGIEAAADVTDATNVAAAGAVMESDTSTASMNFVIDEDDMVSNLATKVPTQQSVKAYVDAELSEVSGSGTATSVAQVDVGVGIGPNASTPSTTTTETGTARVVNKISVNCTDLRLLYINHHETGSGNTVGTDDLVISCSIWVGGTGYRVTFNGAVSYTVKPGGKILSDPLALYVAAGTVVEVRTYVSGTWRPNRYANGPGMGGWTATTDLSAPGAGSIADNTSFRYLISPAAILGTPAVGGNSVPSVFAIGDSITEGNGDGPSGRAGVNSTYSNMGGGGWIGRAATAGGFSLLNAGIGGQTAQVFASDAGHFYTNTMARNHRNCIEGFGRNDLFGSRTLAQLQADVISIWEEMAALGLRIFRTTLVPDTTSTDGWRTTANQTVKAWESDRLAFNAWLRDGAPMSGGVAVATGTGGASRCKVFDAAGDLATDSSGSEHLVYGVIDTAATVESSGKWIAPTVSRTITDGSITSGAAVLGSTSQASFTTADIGRHAVFPGAGASSGILVGLMKNYFSSTQMSVTPNAGTTVSSGGTVYICELASMDGTHPSAFGCALMAAALPVSELLRDPPLATDNGTTSIVGISGTKAQFNTAVTDDDFVYTDEVQTLTNKRITPRLNSTTSNATPALDAAYDATVLTAQTAAITAFSLSGSFTAEQRHMIRIKDNGSARAITWTSSVIIAADGITLPTTTVVGKTHRIGCIYDEVVGKLIAVAVGSY